MNEKSYALDLLGAAIPVIETLESYYDEIASRKQRSEEIRVKAEDDLKKRRNRIQMPLYVALIICLVVLRSNMHVLLKILIVLVGACAAVLYYVDIASPALKDLAIDDRFIDEAETNEQNLQFCQEQFSQYYETNSNIIVSIPEDYRYSEALRFMLKKLRNGRADNLKEAINLYEDYIYKQEMKNEMIRQHQEQLDYLRSIENQSTRAANNAAAAAFFSAANYFNSK